MFKKILIGFGIIAILLTITPFIAVDYWWIRVFDFPHVQLTFLTSFAILIYFIRFNFKSIEDYAFISVLIACCFFQFLKIYPYTSFAPFEALKSDESSKNSIKIFTSNVLQENEKKHLVLEEIKTLNPDLILLTEVNNNWLNVLNKDLEREYEFKFEYPLENTYGMVLYSKLKLINPKLKFLVSDSIPSIHTKILSKNGDSIQLFAIHPTPPVPQENPMSTDRDAEMMMIAKKSIEAKLPVIVLGDFNDVAWSETSKLFKRVSGLLDSRLGRGMFNTFSAKSYILKWPLDHIFISSEFRVKTIEVRNDVNSDHFPLFTEFTFEPEKAHLQKEEKPSKKDLKVANNQIEKFLKNDKRNK